MTSESLIDKFCDHPECSRFPVEKIGDMKACGWHVEWMLQVLQDREFAAEVECDHGFHQ